MMKIARRIRPRMRLHESWLSGRSLARWVGAALERRPVLLPIAALLAGLVLAAAGLGLARAAGESAGLAIGLLLLSAGSVGLLFGVAGLLSAGFVWLLSRLRV